MTKLGQNVRSWSELPYLHIVRGEPSVSVEGFSGGGRHVKPDRLDTALLLKGGGQVRGHLDPQDLNSPGTDIHTRCMFDISRVIPHMWSATIDM